MTLTDKLQSAAQGSRELDAEIANHVAANKGLRGFSANPPQYTTSIDAALTLVPEGWALIKIGSVSVMSKAENGAFKSHLEYEPFLMTKKTDKANGRHRLMPIAICLAALKARGIE